MHIFYISDLYFALNLCINPIKKKEETFYWKQSYYSIFKVTYERHMYVLIPTINVADRSIQVILFSTANFHGMINRKKRFCF